ncbi:hypothetical protein SZ25_00187 [Candidatus Arcanobacter lacustris]|uniref:Uncharacterized protein n=1 Tax=Candidatus Arcanibacter lacustris TaxID=1607817 RepID=A0A0F5MPG4_9RICK|nr:hypothetical protein SZ25_00187 [Candidatus Arcanobacter lacustris]
MKHHTTPYFLYDSSEGCHLRTRSFVFLRQNERVRSTKIFNLQQSTIKNKERWIPSLQFIFFEDKYRSRMTPPPYPKASRCIKNCGVV